MDRPLTPATIGLLVLPQLLWAGNAVVGRMVRDLAPAMTLNLLRWLLALLLLLPLARGLWSLRGEAAIRSHWRRFALLGLLGVGSYNSLQYLALKTSTPLNVTLVAAGTPVWMMLIGRIGYAQALSSRQLAGALLSLAGVLTVLSHGSLAALREVRLLPGDLYMVLATICWAFYSWQLTRTDGPAALHLDWASFLAAQVVFGVGWSGVFSAIEWGVAAPGTRIVWGWPLAAALLYIALGPAIVAYRCWGVGVQRAGPTIAGFFSNLTPLFAALLSAALLGEVPRWFHAAAFVLIVGGIVVSSRR